MIFFSEHTCNAGNGCSKGERNHPGVEKQTLLGKTIQTLHAEQVGSK